PDREIDHRAHGEKSRIQVRALVLKKRISSHIRRARPGINAGHPKQNRNKQNPHERDRPRAGFEYSANGIAPPAARQMMDHQNREAAQRKSDAVDVGENIGLKKFLPAESVLRAGVEKAQD